MQRVVMNLGIGLGALAGGLIATTESPGSFTVLFLLNSLTFVVYVGVMLALVPAPSLDRGSARAAAAAGSYRDVLRHRAFVAVIGLNALFIFAGFSGFELLPVYAKNEAAVSETQIGLVFLVNTIVIVLLQLPIARFAQGRRRMPALGLLGLMWAAAWLIVPIAGSKTAATATLLLIGAMVDLRRRRVPARRGAGAARRRSRGPASARPLHGALGALVAGRLRARAGGRRLRPRLLAERGLGRRGRALRARRRARAGRGGHAARASAADAAPVAA